MSSSLFLFIDKVYGERRLVKKKLSDLDALRVLQKRFSSEVREIYGIIGLFREGMRSYEASYGQKGKKGFTMFHQILHFLRMKEEVDSSSRGELSPGGGNFLPEDEI